MNDFTNTPDYSNQFDPGDIQANKTNAILAYLGPLVLIPLLSAPNSRFARFHSNQGLILLIVDVIASILSVVPIIGWIVSPIVAIGCLVLAILGIINANNGQAKVLPLIGGFTLLK